MLFFHGTKFLCNPHLATHKILLNNFHWPVPLWRAIAVQGMVGSGGSFHAYDPESVAPGRCAALATTQKRRRCHSCITLKGKMTLQKNSSNATRKRKFQEQSENQAISTTTTNSSTTNNSRQQLQIQTEFQILQSLIPGLANQADISEVGVTFDSS